MQHKVYIVLLIFSLVCSQTYRQYGHVPPKDIKSIVLYHDVVYLKDGSIIKGVIIENKTDEYLKIKSGSNILVYTYDKIDKIIKEEIGTTTNYSNSTIRNNSTIVEKTEEELLVEQQQYTIDKRPGFIIGIGGGIHAGVSSLDTDMMNGIFNQTTRYDYEGFQTDFRIGFAPSNSIEIYYSIKRTWWEDDDNEEMFTQLSGVGISYFFNGGLNNIDNKWKPSQYISFTYGDTYFGNQDDEASALEGEGFSIGIGSEYAPHLRVEITYINSKLDYSINLDDNPIKLKYNINEFNITWQFMKF